MSDKEFVDGLIVKAPRDNAPDFVKCAISIKRKDLGNWLRAKDDEWINVDVKVGKSGKWYAEVNDWKPTANQGANPNAGQQQGGIPDGFDDSIPFMRPHDEYFG